MGGENLGKFLLRVTVAGLLLVHGIGRITNGIGGVEELLEGKGLPTWLAYLVYVGEILAPVLVIVGLKTRLAALVMAADIGVGVWLAYMPLLGELQPSGSWALERPAIFLLASLSIMLIGPGGMSIDEKKKRSSPA